ncbi:hypothetical protein [Frigoribacterium faeni]|uniref:Uncharacterized protein n=1 Tax=Frigoribacterium faeni TaxID=145483 RepID=A0A7W3PH19_9MICO|nr:hypothetical protein [Frigoribacterium faeni]MBA8811830.1 hypothetical protein [Frigoribacterium faeni]BFF12809.1 hypothetical protein GCM10025699_41120 [Microbacterium flavescens]GEK84728.1 hypothetical protein FFA01_30370 [Frigoribacterium faeni]
MSTTNSNEPQQGGVTDEDSTFGERDDRPQVAVSENSGTADAPPAPGSDAESADVTGRDATGDMRDRTGTADADDIDELLGDRNDDDEGPRAP